jgi:deazaflavin-dependent oxidoreductase (nitroreductase family)
MPQTKYIRWVPTPSWIKRIDKIHVPLYRFSRGLLGGRLDGLDFLLLTTTGKKTGLARTVPLPFFRDGSRYVLIGSFGGNAKNPAWIGNLTATPRVDVQVRARKFTAHAQVAQGAERERIWNQVTHDFPRYHVYQAKTARQIPVVVLEPAAACITDGVAHRRDRTHRLPQHVDEQVRVQQRLHVQLSSIAVASLGVLRRNYADASLARPRMDRGRRA